MVLFLKEVDYETTSVERKAIVNDNMQGGRLGLQVQNEAAEIKIRAERKAGEYFKQIERKQGERTDRTSPTIGPSSTPYTSV